MRVRRERRKGKPLSPSAYFVNEVITPRLKPTFLALLGFSAHECHYTMPTFINKIGEAGDRFGDYFVWIAPICAA